MTAVLETPLLDPAGPVTAAAPPPPPEDQRWVGDDRPRSVGRRTTDDIASLVGAGASSLALTWLMFDAWLNLSGKLGFVLFWYVMFLVLYVVASAMSNSRTVVVDRLASSAVLAGASVVLGALGWIVLRTFVKGFPALVHLNFFTQDASGARPTDGLTHGGVKHAIVGSLIEVGIAICITLPLGVGTAVFMTEVRGRLSRIIRTIVEAMTALPSIVAGLFIYSVVVVDNHVAKSGLTAALAISVMMLPIIARAAEVQLRIVPGGLREASLALGASQWQTVRRVILRTARPGLATALILGIARGIGETSPVLLTSGESTFFNANPLDHKVMQSLPLYILGGARSGEDNPITRAYGAASVLLAIVLVLFVITRLLARTRVGGR